MSYNYVTNGDEDGSMVGRTAQDKIGFYGATPLAQQGNSNQHLIQRDIGGRLILFSSTLAAYEDQRLPPQTTTRAQLLTVPGVTPNDLLLGVSKVGYVHPYGYTGARITAADQIEVTFTNPSADFQTLGEADSVWSGLILRGMLSYSIEVTRVDLFPRSTFEQIVDISGYGAQGEAIIDSDGQVVGVVMTNQGNNYRLPPKVVFTPSQTSDCVTFSPVGAGASATAVLDNDGTVGGVIITNPGQGYTTAPQVSFVSYSDITQDQIIFAYPTEGPLPAGVGVGNVRFYDANSIAITFYNLTDKFIPGETMFYDIWGLDSAMPTNSILSFQFPGVDFPATGANFASQTRSMRVAGMTSEDLVLSAAPAEVPAPSQGVGCWQGATASDGEVAIHYTGPSSSWQPPDNVMDLHILRAYKLYPMLIWQQLVTPYAIAPGEVREFIFTSPFFSGFSDHGGFFAWASKPSHTQGITLAGCRVANSGATIGVCLQNVSTRTITPPAELYTFCVAPVPIVSIAQEGVDYAMTSLTLSHSTQKLVASHNEILRTIGLLGLMGGG